MDGEEYEITTKSVLELLCGAFTKRSTINHTITLTLVNSASWTWKISLPGGPEIQKKLSAQHHSTENQIQSSLRPGVPARQPKRLPLSGLLSDPNALSQREWWPVSLKLKVDRVGCCLCPKCMTLEGDSTSLVASGVHIFKLGWMKSVSWRIVY